MKILITNDDGIQSLSLMNLAKTLAVKHEVFVVAPNSQRSAFSHSVTFHKRNTYEKIEIEGTVGAYVITGTPADCVKFGTMHRNFIPDIVISGPNQGFNYGTDIIYSGTVSAAIEGTLLGYKSIAISLGVHEDTPAEQCARFLLENLEKLACIEMPNVTLNINMANIPYEEYKGIAVTKMWANHYFNDYYETDDDNGFILRGNAMAVENVDCDINLARRGYITVTPLKIDRTDYDSMKKIEEVLL